MCAARVRLAYASELREDVRVARLVPVAEAAAHEPGIGGPRCALQHEVLAVEEIGRVSRIALDVGIEVRERSKRSVGPLPAVSDQSLHAPGTRALRRRAGRTGRPVGKVEIAVLVHGRIASPGKGTLTAIGTAEGRPVKLGLTREAGARP